MFVEYSTPVGGSVLFYFQMLTVEKKSSGPSRLADEEVVLEDLLSRKIQSCIPLQNLPIRKEEGTFDQS